MRVKVSATLRALWVTMEVSMTGRAATTSTWQCRSVARATPSCRCSLVNCSYLLSSTLSMSSLCMKHELGD